MIRLRARHQGQWGFGDWHPLVHVLILSPKAPAAARQHRGLVLGQPPLPLPVPKSSPQHHVQGVRRGPRQGGDPSTLPSSGVPPRAPCDLGVLVRMCFLHPLPEVPALQG